MSPLIRNRDVRVGPTALLFVAVAGPLCAGSCSTQSSDSSYAEGSGTELVVSMDRANSDFGVITHDHVHVGQEIAVDGVVNYVDLRDPEVRVVSFAISSVREDDEDLPIGGLPLPEGWLVLDKFEVVSPDRGMVGVVVVSAASAIGDYELDRLRSFLAFQWRSDH